MPEVLANQPQAGTLASSVTSSATTLTLTTGHGAGRGYPATGTYRVAVYDAATGANFEVMTVASRSGDTLTVARGQEGTTGVAHNAGDPVELILTKGALQSVFAPFDVRFFGARADHRRVTDAAITSGTATLTSATAAFTAADAGKTIVVAGAGAASATLTTTVASVTNATTVVLSVNASTTVSGAATYLATDDGPAIQAAIDAAEAAGGGTVLLPRGIYLVGATLTVDAPVSIVGQGTFDVNLDAGDAANAAVSLILWAGGAARVFDVVGPVYGPSFRDFAVDGVGVATHLFYCDRVRAAQWQHLRLVRCATAGMYFGTSSASANDNSMFCLVANVTLERMPTCVVLDGNVAVTANTCHNTFVNLYCDFTGDALDLVSCDNNAFYNTYTFQRSGSGYSVRFREAAGSNYFYHFQGNALAETPLAAGGGNAIFGYDRSNGQAQPVVQAGAKLLWTEDGYNAAGWFLPEKLSLGTTTSTHKLSVESSGDNHLRLIRTGSSYVYESYVRSDRIWYFVKPTGDTASSLNAIVKFGVIGGADAINPFWNGFHWQGHTVTEGGTSRFPIVSFYSRSATLTDPTDYEFAFDLGNAGTLPAGVRYAVPDVAGSRVRWLFGTTERMRLGRAGDLMLSQVATPSAPASGFTSLYTKTGGGLYLLPNGGSETQLESRDRAGAASGYATLDTNTRVPDAQLGTGTPTSLTFLRGDRTWAPTIDEAPRMLNPVAWMGAANITTVTILVTNTSYFLYLGRAGKVLTSMSVVCRVTAAAATITWAEVGIFKGTLVAGGNATNLTRLGFTNVAATFNSTGLKTTAVTLSGHAAEDDLWVAFGSQATTPYQIRAGLADDIGSGGFQSVAARISTMGASTGTVNSTLAVPWCQVTFA